MSVSWNSLDLQRIKQNEHLVFHHSVSRNIHEPDASEVCSLSDPFPQAAGTPVCVYYLSASVDLAVYFLLTVDFLITWDLLMGWMTLHLSETLFQMETSLESPREGWHQRKATTKPQGQCERRANELSISVCIEREPVSLQMCLSATFTFCLFGVISYHMETSGMCPFAKSTFLVSSKWPGT